MANDIYITEIFGEWEVVESPRILGPKFSTKQLAIHEVKRIISEGKEGPISSVHLKEGGNPFRVIWNEGEDLDNLK